MTSNEAAGENTAQCELHDDEAAEEVAVPPYFDEYADAFAPLAFGHDPRRRILGLPPFGVITATEVR